MLVPIVPDPSRSFIHSHSEPFMESCTQVVIPLPNGLLLVLRSKQELSSARFIIREVFRNQVYRRSGFEFRPTDTVVDIGGNIGLFALWAAPQVARVFTVEPTKAIDCLALSLARNEIDNVTIVRCAVSDKTGTVELMEHPGFNAVTHLASFQPSRWGQRCIRLLCASEQQDPIRVSCPSQTLEQVFQTQNIDHVDFLKIDCEGGEYAILNSISDSTLARISRISMEFHKLHPDHDHRLIVRRLQSAGYDVTIKRTLLDRLAGRGMLWAKQKRALPVSAQFPNEIPARSAG
jgi:FkbM family methyltransferase